MNPVGDAFTVGIVLLLLIGAVAFYLYTRLSQVEKRINLLENILLDLKVATENAFPGFPLPVAGGGGSVKTSSMVAEEASIEEEAELLSEYVPKLPTATAKTEETEEEADETSMYEQALESALDSAVIDGNEGDADALPVEADEELLDSRPVEISADAGLAAPKSEVHVNKLNPNYAEMTVKELRTLAQNRGVAGVGKMSRKEIIEALHKKDSGVMEGIEASNSSLAFESSLTGNAASIDA